MSAFVTLDLSGDTADVRPAYWENQYGPAAAIRLGNTAQLVGTSSDPAVLRALAAALVEMADWREAVLAASTKAVA
jgi:hypothetical protein